MAKRMILMFATMAVLIAVLGTVKFRQIQFAAAQAASFQPPPEAVTTIVANREEWPASLSAMVSADLPGIIDRIAFDSGKTVQAGEVLVQLDTRQEQAQLAAAEAQRDLARLNLDRMTDLHRQGITSQSDYDRTAAEHKQAEARVGEIRATIDRKKIRAPFTGLLGIRQVNLGQYLKGGDPVVPLQSLQPIYVNFTVPQQEAGKARVGGGVLVSFQGMAGAARPGRRQPDRGPPGLRDQLCPLRRFGLRRGRREGSERPELPRGAAAVRQAGRLPGRPGRGGLGTQGR